MGLSHPRTILTYLLLLACVALATGCATTPADSVWRAQRSEALRDVLLTLGEHVDYAEATRLSDKAVEKSIALAQQYRVVRPPWVHNNLVNLRLRERGLCYEWANDLFADLQQLNIKSLKLHLAVARMDTRREHNALVVTASGQSFSDGLVLDAWRRSGRIWWGRAATDKYPWQPLPFERVNPALQKLVSQ